LSELKEARFFTEPGFFVFGRANIAREAAPADDSAGYGQQSDQWLGQDTCQNTTVRTCQNTVGFSLS